MRVFSDVGVMSGRQGAQGLPRFRRPVVTVGSFDGVHRGHLFLLDVLRQRAEASRGESVVVTFGEHPRSIVGEGVRMLTTLDEKARLLEAAGVDNLVVMPFDKEVSRLSAEEFVREFLVARVGVHELVVGYNHRLGRGREGDATVLGELGTRYGFRLFRAQPFMGDDADSDEKISSTAIRRALARGDVETAERMLGRTLRK